MENESKAKRIREWSDPEERVTVDFDDAKDLNAEVTGCNAEVVTLALETPFPHLRQDIAIPLGKVEVGELEQSIPVTRRSRFATADCD